MKRRGLLCVSLFLCLSFFLNFCFPWSALAKASGDRTAPYFRSGYPKVTNLQSRQVSFSLKSNERGKAYFVVVPNNAKAPTAAQIKAGKNAYGQAVTPLLKGYVNLCANKEACVTIKGLVAATSFDVYFTVEDRALNLQSRVTKVDIKTKAIFIAGYPKFSNIQSNQASLSLKLNENGRVYYVVLPKNAKVPSVTQIKKGMDAYCRKLPGSLKGYINLSANKEACVTMKGMKTATAYDVYLFITDINTGQAKSWIVKVDLTTKATNCNPVVPAAPTGLAGVKPTTAKNNDGRITGVNSKMEYKLQNTTTWIKVNATAITGLVPGTYEVRFQAVGNNPAGKIAIVKVPVYVAPPVIDKEIIAVSACNDIEVDYGTVQGKIGLPTNVTVTLNDRSTRNLAVRWDGGKPAYNGNMVGTYLFTGTLTLVNGIANTKGHKASIKVIVKATPVYTIDVTAPDIFANQTEGYARVAAHSVTINRTGTGDITNLAVTLNGINADSFIVTQPVKSTLNKSNPSTTFTIKPKDGLKAGKYNAQVVITANNGIRQSFSVSFTVNAAKSKEAILTGLTVSTGSIAFNSETLTYSVIVPNATRTVKVSFTAASGATTSVSSPQTVAITNGIGTFSVVVTAEDGVTKRTYTINFKEKVAAPTASPQAGEVDKGTWVALSTKTAGANIYYTTDGSRPTTSSTLYQREILINDKSIIKAIAVKNGMANSEVSEFVYTVPYIPITPIRDFTSSTITETTATFKWTAVVEADSIKVQQSTDSGENWVDAQHTPIATNATMVTVTGLTSLTTYKFKLVVKGGNNAGDSNIVDVTTTEKTNEEAYGAIWTYGPSTEMIRVGAAKGKTEGEDFDKAAPWSGITLCNVSDDGKITAYINDANFKRDGSNGQVMVKIPKFYYKHTYDDENKVHGFWVAGKPTPGFKLHPCFIRNDVEKNYVLVGAYKASLGKTQNGKLDTLSSITGTMPANAKTRAEFRTLIQARGAGWNQIDVFTRNAIALLYLVEYANTDSQEAIGLGVVSSCGYVRSGGCDTLNGASGTAKYQGCKEGQCSVSYRGIEDLWGNIWEYIDGINLHNGERQAYIADSNFADDKFHDNYYASGLNLSSGHGCITNFGYSAHADWLLMPSETKGDNRTFIPDSYYPGWWYAGHKVPFVGGVKYSGKDAGLFALFVSKTAAEKESYIGARIQLVP